MAKSCEISEQPIREGLSCEEKIVFENLLSELSMAIDSLKSDVSHLKLLFQKTHF